MNKQNKIEKQHSNQAKKAGESMDDNMISRAEHDEFVKRMEQENDRQNHRIGALEDSIKEIAAMSTSVNRLATNMENMAKEQERQGKRLEILENRDGEMWRKVVGYVITAVVGVVVGFIFTRLGM